MNTCSINIKLFLIVVLCLFTCQDLLAQQCGYTNHAAIVINVTAIETNAKIQDLKMVLCDRDGNAYGDYNWNCNDNNTLGQYDSFTFWENKHLPKQKKRTCTDKFIRQSFDGVDDYYICVVPTYTGDIDFFKPKRNLMRSATNNNDYHKISERDIFFYVKIKGQNVPEQIVKIPNNAKYDICDCSLYSTHTDCVIDPIHIVINNGKATVQDKRFGVIQVNESSETFEKFSFDGHYVSHLEQVHLIDEITGNILQTIPNRKEAFGNKIFSNHAAIQYFNAERYSINVAHPRIIIPAKFKIAEWSQEALKNKQYKSYIIYKYDDSLQRYVIDTIMSQHDYISIEYDKINPSFNAIYAMDVQESATSFYYKYYKLQDTWQFSGDEKIDKVIEAAIEKIPKKGTPNCAFYVKEKYKPVQYFEEGVDSITIKDTFYLYNAGTATAKLKKTYGDGFTLSNSLEVGEKLPVYYSRTFHRKKLVSHDPISPYLENVVVEFDSNKSVNAVLQFSFINSNATIKKNSNGKKVFYVPHNTNEFYEVNIDSNNNIIGYGKKLITDSTELGIWNYTDPTNLVKSQKHFKKALQLYIQPEPLVLGAIIYLIYHNGDTILHSNNANRNLLYYISDRIASVVVRNDSAIGSCDIDFAKLQQLDYKVIYLLKPSDNYYYLAKDKVPFNFHPTRFHIRWQYENSSIDNDKQKLLQLKDDFPKLEILFANRDYKTDVIDFVNCGEKEREKILNYLKAHIDVQYVSQLWHFSKPSFCDNRIYIPLDYKKIPKQTLLSIEALGFKYDQLHYGINEVQSIFKFSGKIVDDTFIKQYNKIMKLLDFPRATLNIYMQIDYDDEMKMKRPK